MSILSNFTFKSNKVNEISKQFITKAIISNINNYYNVKLVEDGENIEIIKLINNRLQAYDNLYNNSKDSITCINNKKINNKVKQLEQKYKEEIYLLKSKVKKYEENHEEELDKYIDRHQKINEESNRLSLELEKNKIKDKFYNEIKKKDIEITQLKHEMVNLSSITNIEKTLNHRFNAFNKYFDGKMSTQDKGVMGETHLLNHIKKIIDMSDGYIEKVSGEANSGDLFMSYKNMKCCIESKNHTSTVSSKEINRFLYTDLQNPRYNCGLFISHKTGFPNSSHIKHFQIKIENNKPCIFLSHIQDNLTDISLAIKVLSFLLTVDYNVDKISIINQLKQDLTSFKELEDISNQNIKNLNKSCKIISKKYDEIEALLDTYDTVATKGKKRKRKND